ncbi:acetylglutamate kinase [Armatimonadetes bacterium Uphvl-Ar1]|nr:acetylglutamate kinase [Armatimonadetes bacterium Uphvl-Ar1]
MQSTTVQALRHALPYLEHYRGKLFVLKCGGEALGHPSHLASLIEQIAVLHQLGIQIALVHGGAPQATQLAKTLGQEPTFIDGRRVTTPEALESTIMAINGLAQATLLAAARRQNLPAIGLSGIDHGIIQSTKRPPVKTSQGTKDFGQVGDIQTVNCKPLKNLIANQTIPFMSPISADSEGQILNINADDVAAQIALALGATKLILVTTPRGILSDPGDQNSLISQLTLSELDQLHRSGIISTGMLPKSKAIRTALENGVERVHVISYQFPDSILTEVFTNEGCGTLILND